MPPSELNLSYLQASTIRVGKRVKDLQKAITNHLKQDEQDVRSNWKSSGKECWDMLRKWEGASHEWIKGFVRMFSKRREEHTANNGMWKRQEANTLTKEKSSKIDFFEALTPQPAPSKVYNQQDGEPRSESPSSTGIPMANVFGDTIFKTLRHWTTGQENSEIVEDGFTASNSKQASSKIEKQAQQRQLKTKSPKNRN